MSHRVFPKKDYMEHVMRSLSDAGFHFLKFEDAVKMIDAKIQPDKPYVAFSFDDGFSECADTICPVLEDYGVNAMFFVNPGFIEGDDNYIYNFTNNVMNNPGKTPMSWDTLSNLIKRGHLVGAHTIDHYMINTNDIKELTHQIVDCKIIIENKLSIKCDCFAWPFGRFDHTNTKAIEIACNTYSHVFSLTDHNHYFSFDGNVMNRRHFEPFWPIKHIMYFLCQKKHY